MGKFQLDLKNAKQVTIIAVAATAGFLYLYVNFLLLPQISGITKAYKKLNNISSEVKAAERDVSKVDGLRKQVEASRDRIESYERTLPAGQEIPKLLSDLSDMAKRSGVKIVGITPLPPKDDKVPAQTIYQEIPILISAKSGYHELGKFISNLETSDRFMKVADISIKSNKASPKRHDVEILVLTYILLVNG